MYILRTQISIYKFYLAEQSGIQCLVSERKLAKIYLEQDEEELEELNNNDFNLVFEYIKL